MGAAAALALLLGGCSSTRIIDNDVQSYSTLAAMPEPPTYRIERLPSQQQPSPQRGMIERLATEALGQVGMQRDDANGALRLELSSYANAYLPNWPHYSNFGFGMGYGPWGWGPGFGYYGYMRDLPPTLYVYQVRLVLRDAQGQPVYETSARYDDIWRSDEQIFRLLFQSALDGFPTPPQGERRIRHQIQP
ncbi:hypothetical protein D8I35_14025 [Corticibacter populi]|uniref:DUF4136 domain-containing protein n=1 Tax=Corticibacter populi TaxID=1550736 RepID=A0A3M6QRN1_9BURK|nr:hypothetical protein D8I35_14025 [Corticibacter populi]